MKPEQWKEIESLYQACIELPPAQRARFLAEACADAEIRDEVESLLEHRHKKLTFIERQGLDSATDMPTRNHAQTLVGRTIGHYQVLAFIGAGGMEKSIGLETRNLTAMWR